MKFVAIVAVCVLMVCSISNAFVLPGSAWSACASSRLTAPARSSPSRVNGEPLLKMSISIEVGEDESLEHALGRFRRDVSRSGHLQDMRVKRHFESTQEKKKRKLQQNRRRNRIMRARARKINENSF